MADEQPGFLRGLINRPMENIRSGMSEWRAHPFQEALQRLIGVGGSAIGGPGLGMAAGQGADRLFNMWNNRGARNVEQFKPEAEAGMRQFGDQLNSGIWNQQGAAQGPAQSGMPGITSPWQGSNQGSYSPLQQMLGIPNYTQPQQPQQGLPGITSPLPPGMGPAATQPAPGGYMGWAQSGARPQIGTGTGPNPFNVVGRTDRFSDAAT